MDIERKLATATRILDLQPIPNSDFLERATVRGWHVVVKKGEFKVGELICYMEIDSLIKPIPALEFLRKDCLKTINGVEYFRIRTKKIRGVCSQGLIVKLEDLFEISEIEGKKFIIGVYDGSITSHVREATSNVINLQNNEYN